MLVRLLWLWVWFIGFGISSLDFQYDVGVFVVGDDVGSERITDLAGEGVEGSFECKLLLF